MYMNWNVRQFFLRQFFCFSSTIQEQVVFRLCFCTCHWSKSELIEVRINRTKTGEDLTSINSNFDFLRLGQVRLGQVRLGQVRLGQVRLGQVRLGQVRLGQVRLGQVRLGQVMNFFSSKTRPSNSRSQSVLNCRRKASRT